VESAKTVDSPHEDITTSVVFTPRTSKWAYVSWQISDTEKQALQNEGVSQLVLRLYDVTGIDLSYQAPHLVQQYELETITRDRFVTIPTSDRDYITEIGHLAPGDRWVSIARSATVRVFSHPHTDFWFVADAELIIHGATEPNASVTIGKHTIKLKPDGTFHLRIPFSDSLIEYLITAAAADGGHAKTIHKKFSQEIPGA
jgi:phosphate transport system substrate-binding protein